MYVYMTRNNLDFVLQLVVAICFRLYLDCDVVSVNNRLCLRVVRIDCVNMSTYFRCHYRATE